MPALLINQLCWMICLQIDEHDSLIPLILPVHDKVNISAGGKVIKSVTISSMNGTTVASENKASKTVTLDVSAIATGIYIVNIQTEDGTYSCKILKL